MGGKNTWSAKRERINLRRERARSTERWGARDRDQVLANVTEERDDE